MDFENGLFHDPCGAILVQDDPWGEGPHAAMCRRLNGFLDPLILISFSPKTAGARWPLFASGVPGSYVVGLPLSLAQLEARAHGVSPLPVDQLAEVQRRHCGLQATWSAFAHRLASLVVKTPPNTKSEIDRWRASVARYAPECLGAFEQFEAAKGRADTLRALGVLEDKLYLTTRVPPPAPCAKPPRGYGRIGIADDGGVFHPPTINRLRDMGYEVLQPIATSREEGQAMVERYRPRILLCDLNMPLAEDGLGLMRYTLDGAPDRIVIAVSKARIPAGLLPEGVLASSGGLDWADADRLHRLIWMRACDWGVQSNDR